MQFLLEDNLQQLSKKLGISVSELRKTSRADIDVIMKYVGKHDFSPISEFDPIQLKKGIAIEKEHTTSTLVAELIAKDHLKEDPKYYTKLSKIEKDG